MDGKIAYKLQCDKIIRIANKISRAINEPHYCGTEDLLYASEIHVIDVIGRYPNINVSEVAEKLGIGKSAIPKIIKKLTAKNMVSRHTPPENKKMVQLQLTEKGKIAYKAHLKFHEKFDRNLIKRFTNCTQEEYAFFDRFTIAIEEEVDSILTIKGIKK